MGLRARKTNKQTMFKLKCSFAFLPTIFFISHYFAVFSLLVMKRFFLYFLALFLSLSVLTRTLSSALSHFRNLIFHAWSLIVIYFADIKRNFLSPVSRRPTRTSRNIILCVLKVF